MAKNEGLLIAVAIIVAVILLGNQQQAPQPSVNNGGGGTGIDLCKLVDGQMSFTGQRLFLTGTSLPTEAVRVIRQGSIMDLGTTTMNSGTLAVTPNVDYKLYFGENATTGSSASYYTAVETYKTLCQDATDDKVGVLCAVDTTPSITVFDENNQVQSITTVATNAQAMGASDVVDVKVKVKVSADKCYGNPGSPKMNAICFSYNSTAFDSVKANTPVSVVPYSVSSDPQKPAGYAQSCYEMNKLSDTGSQIFTVTLDASSTEPVNVNAINITLEDTAFDLDQDTLGEIWGFEDETNNNLGLSIQRKQSIQVT